MHTRLCRIFGATLATSLVPRLSKTACGGEEEESLVSAVYACASFTQILGKTVFCPCILRLQNVITRDVIISSVTQCCAAQQ